MEQRRRVRKAIPVFFAVLAVFLLVDQVLAQKVTRIVPPLETGREQAYQNPLACQPCHPRQFRENRQSVKSGYRNFSPTFNALELGGNAVVQGLLDGGVITTNLRPTNVFNEPVSNVVNTDAATATNTNVRAGFCIGCHNGPGIGAGANWSPDLVEVQIPPWDGHLIQNPDGPEGQLILTGTTIRPLRDYHFVDSDGNQILPDTIGGPPPAGSVQSALAYGINCDYCHNVTGPATERSLQGDGFANNAVQILYSNFKVGSFANAFPPRGNFHQSSNNTERINYLRSPLLCNGCHDVRVPSGDLISIEDPTDAPGVSHYRLENLSTEWAIGPYNVPSQNPFGQSVRCQDCHMSMYPYAGNTTYNVTDQHTGDVLSVTSPTPAVFPINFAAEGVNGIINGDFGTVGNVPLPRRRVSTHYFTGVDVPLLRDEELKTFLGDDYPSPYLEGFDDYGIPLSLATRREDLLQASVRIDLDRSDQEAALGDHFKVRARLIALTGHRFPSGFSQERGVWVRLNVTAKRKDTGEDFVLYQSGYKVDKPHPEVDEFEPDGSFDDEDQEHLEAIVNPFTHDNEVFGFGPDDGPHARIFEGLQEGLVFFRNELVRIYGPAEFNGNQTGIPGNARLHPRTGEPLDFIIEEETFSAGLTTFVDNWRSLPPLEPRTYVYDIELPSAEELAEYGVELEGPLQVTAEVQFRHFPPLFLRFLSRAVGSYVERNLHNSDRLAPFVGLSGVANVNIGLWDEQRIDDLLRVQEGIDSDSLEIPLDLGEPAETTKRWSNRRAGGSQ